MPECPVPRHALAHAYSVGNYGAEDIRVCGLGAVIWEWLARVCTCTLWASDDIVGLFVNSHANKTALINTCDRDEHKALQRVMVLQFPQ